MARWTRFALLLAALAWAWTSLAAPPAGAAKRPTKAQEKLIEQLPEPYRKWLEEVDVLLTDEEREAFLKIEQDYQRDAFIERFWQARDPYTDTGRNELRDRWNDRVQQARQLFGSLKEDRSRMLLLNGPPDGSIKPRCSQVLWPLEIWFYDGSERIRDRFFLYFVQRYGMGAYRLWDPGEGVSSLLQFSGGQRTGDGQALNEIISNCPNGDEIAGALNWAIRQGPMSYSMLVARLEAPPEGPGGEWVSTFSAYSTDLQPGTATFPATLEVRFPARRQNRTVVQGVVGVAPGDATRSELGTSRSFNFLLNGEVLREGKLFESFRYKFDLPSGEVTGDSIPLVFERYLRPGKYNLVVKVEDLNGKKFARQQREIEVPAVEGPEIERPVDSETARLLAEANAAIRSGENTIQIIPPPGDLQTGLVRFDTLVTGAKPAEVAFGLNGKRILAKRTPPWSVELDLGTLPRNHLLRVEAFDGQGRVLANDELQINVHPNRFAVKLVEPRPGQKYSKSLRAEAEVETPEGQVVERVEFYLNEALVATLYQAPFAQPVVLPPGDPIAYVRAVAYLPDGNSTERVVFVNAPDYLEEVEVQLVELFATVIDRGGHPVQNLKREDFQVSEDGQPQEIRRFEQVQNLPVHVGVLLDTSASMENDLEEAREAALHFFQQVVTPKDRAAVVTFNDRPTLGVKFTNDLGALAGGLAGVKAERGTALYDSVVFALYYLNGIRGQRALLVISDGRDESSRFSFDETLDFARRAGVAIYPVGLGFERSDREAKKHLSRLAEETGGRSFFIESVAELEAVYKQLQEELRSRYLIAYQSTNTAPGEKFRTVELKVGKSGLEAKTLRGYYP